MTNRIKLHKMGEEITVWTDQLAIMVSRGWKEGKPPKTIKKKTKVIEINDDHQITENIDLTAKSEE
tara:strand:+ start:314 stop:511 length:198 start_codon:yes stop_codon:yes gene_type:complete